MCTWDPSYQGIVFFSVVLLKVIWFIFVISVFLCGCIFVSIVFLCGCTFVITGILTTYFNYLMNIFYTDKIQLHNWKKYTKNFCRWYFCYIPIYNKSQGYLIKVKRMCTGVKIIFVSYVIFSFKHFYKAWKDILNQSRN